jgi:hypothetical protein
MKVEESSHLFFLGGSKTLKKKKNGSLTKRQQWSPFTLCRNCEGLGVGEYKTKEGFVWFLCFLCFFCSFQRRMETQKRHVGGWSQHLAMFEGWREKELVADTRQCDSRKPLK